MNIALKLRDRNPKDKRGRILPRLTLQVLLYPVLQVVDLELPSYQQNKDMTSLWSVHDMHHLVSHALIGNTSLIPYLRTGSHVPKEFRVSMAEDRLSHDLIPPDQKYPPYKPPRFHDGDTKIWNTIKDVLFSVELSPILAESHKHLPPAYVYSCQYDVLRDDSYIYARRLRDSGVEVHHYNDAVGFHGNLQFLEILEDSERAWRKMTEFVKSKL